MVKNTLKLALLVTFIVLWYPNFGLSDIFTFAIIAHIGMSTYLILSIIFAIIIYNLIDGNGISGKFKTITSEIKTLFK